MILIDTTPQKDIHHSLLGELPNVNHHLPSTFERMSRIFSLLSKKPKKTFSQNPFPMSLQPDLLGSEVEDCSHGSVHLLATGNLRVVAGLLSDLFG